MIDELHDDLLSNIGYLMESHRERTPAVSEALEPLFSGALKYLAEREGNLTKDDWIKVGRWLNECKQYFGDFDFVFHSIVFSKNPSRSGKQVENLSGFVSKARAAYQEFAKQK